MKKILFIILTLTCFTAKSQNNTWLITQTGQAEYDSARVFTADSNIAFITPSTLDDSTAALRADFPTVPSLYYQNVQLNYSPQTQRGYLNFGSTFTVVDELINNSTNIDVYSSPRLTTARTIQGVSFDGTANINPINGTGFVKSTGTTLSYDNSTYLTTAAATSGYQPLDADLTTLSGLTATTNNFIVSVGSAWASRTPTQVKATLAIANTDVSGLGTLSTQNGTFSGTSSGTNTGDNAANTTSNTYADGKVADAINDGTTSVAPSQNAVFDALALKANLASPTFTGIPVLANPTATSLNTGTTLNGTIFAKSTNNVSLASNNHALTFGNEATGINGAFGLYGTGVGVQARNNGLIGVFHQQPLGGDYRIGFNAPAGVMNMTGFHTGSGTGDYFNFELRNNAGAAAVDAIFMRIMGINWTPSGMMKQRYGVIGTGTNISGLAIGTQGAAPLEFWSNNTNRGNLESNGHWVFLTRAEFSKGANVASAGDLTLGSAGNTFSITGTTTINAINTTSWQAGSEINLIFTGILTLKNNTAGGAGTAKILTRTGADITTAANMLIKLIYDGTNWIQPN